MASVTTTTINLIKNVLAAGTVTLPMAFRCTSFFPGIALTLLVCLNSAYGFILIARCCSENVWSYKSIAIRAFGNKMGWWTDVLMFAYTGGSCVSFIDVIADSIPPVMFAWNMPDILLNRYFVVVLSSIILYPLCALENLEPLKSSSSIGNLCVLYTIIAVIANSHSKPADDVSSFAQSDIHHNGFQWFALSWDMFRSIPLLSVAFAAHYSAPKFLYELVGDMKKWTKVVILEAIIVFTGYMGLSWAGYIQFGAHTKGNILMNYSADNQTILAARLAMSFAVMFTFPFAFHCMRDTLKSLISKPSSWIMNVGLLAITVVVAFLFPQIEVVLAFKGAIFGSLMIYIFPGLFYLKISSLRRGEDEDVDADHHLLHASSPHYGTTTTTHHPPQPTHNNHYTMDGSGSGGSGSGGSGGRSGIESGGGVVGGRLLAGGNGPFGLAWSESWLPVALITFGVVTGILGTVIVAIKVSEGE